ncbi:MAG: hypothetical protein HY692_02385 [Cyanobacteria bacterium NC_groundwater_1444_Ag_S-0.65um_54_12]|nr:hypothetical protein [Cyanobacteria bacterium NC_groundwater_1444_Ag_S-0.65um_54_12]
MTKAILDGIKNSNLQDAEKRIAKGVAAGTKEVMAMAQDGLTRSGELGSELLNRAASLQQWVANRTADIAAQEAKLDAIKNIVVQATEVNSRWWPAMTNNPDHYTIGNMVNCWNADKSYFMALRTVVDHSIGRQPVPPAFKTLDSKGVVLSDQASSDLLEQVLNMQTKNAELTTRHQQLTTTITKVQQTVIDWRKADEALTMQWNFEVVNTKSAADKYGTLDKARKTAEDYLQRLANLLTS